MNRDLPMMCIGETVGLRSGGAPDNSPGLQPWVNWQNGPCSERALGPRSDISRSYRNERRASRSGLAQSDLDERVGRLQHPALRRDE